MGCPACEALLNLRDGILGILMILTLMSKMMFQGSKVLPMEFKILESLKSEWR